MKREPSSISQGLIGPAKAGSAESLGRLFEIYANYLKVLAATRLDAKLRHRVSPSDVVQETFLEATRDFPQFHGATQPELLAWLRKILVNNLARVIERHVLAGKRDVRREVSLQQLAASLEKSTLRLDAILADPGRSPSELAASQDAAVLLADELAQLPDDYRQVLILRNLEGLSFPEVAKQMNRSHGAVRMLWLRAIERLRSGLGAGETV
ncbi:MAG: sigma-70 family RNA polymerase sigma factor [Planctomycetales bacterium]|nr:sigma-70 family RNA polymerase sigma factor [Planctomycetales bacterium]